MKTRFLMHFLNVFLLLTAVAGCTTSTLKIDSTPEGADVYLLRTGETPRKIGQTPLNLPESTIGTNLESFQLTVSKAGFQPENMLIPPSLFSTFSRSTSIQVKLTENISTNKVVNDQILQSVTRTIAQSQALMRTKNYDQVERTLSSLSDQYPGVATIHELLGNMFYLKRDMAKALGAYKRAYDLNPSNIDTQRMIEKIEGFKPSNRDSQ